MSRAAQSTNHQQDPSGYRKNAPITTSSAWNYSMPSGYPAFVSLKPSFPYIILYTMKCFFAIASVLVFAMAAPTPQPQLPDSNANAIAHIRLIGDANQHYSIGHTQAPSAQSGSIISVLVGQSIDFSSNAPRLQEIEISRISQGESLEGVAVSENDGSVICKALIKGSSDGPTFSVKDVGVLLDEGRTVKLTGLACWVEPKGSAED
ncbi:uncharacterized protein K460DRAFT_409726 [Cucurbitaria berberidis CBS 394.84]|uniref:Uncharacterized protein n=1 Tax=Cucurbitaria berberidis CBS 394.84 TaxID=1168544 RepID=A0A9P4GB20_9PLEO|nr:uncharacterized protein K460DRAFT_409726 [Cucurbitaria berberidis CBS 394.84]KAF1842310.1 hypothetical protein K460DRAFT_409726 [Cucurbitaria berberidis CBS 394.84]